jgi:asparagine N-glycosylation enzyme membrane subunit Stt3
VVLSLLYGLSRILEIRNLRKIYFPIGILVLGLIGLVGLYLVDSSLFKSFIHFFDIFVPNNYRQTISEARPLFFAQGLFSLAPTWKLFTTGLILAPVSFIILCIATVKKQKNEILFFLVCSFLICLATMGQIRFAEYLTVNLSILSGYICMRIVDWIPGLMKWWEYKAPRQETRKKDNKRKKAKIFGKEIMPLSIKQPTS